ncbi:MAG: hypothetical protein IIU33_01790 [Bacteroidales bacterium]|nr:hypothetical protein [Bacteroidales bacterium]
MLGIVNNETQQQAQATPTPQPPKQEAAGLDGYLEYLGIPRQEYANEPTGDIPDSNPFPDDAETEQPEDNTRANGFNPDNYYEPSEIKTIENNINFSMLPAESIVEVVDLGMVKGAELIAKEPQEGATDDEKEKLTKIWAMFLAGKNANISHGWMLLVMIVLIYGPKFYGAYQIRKAKIEAEEARIEAQEAKRRAEAQRHRAEKAEKEAEELRRRNDIVEQVRRIYQQQPPQTVEYEEVRAAERTAPETVEDVTAGAIPETAPETPKPEAKPKEAKATKTTKKTSKK